MRCFHALRCGSACRVRTGSTREATQGDGATAPGPAPKTGAQAGAAAPVAVTGTRRRREAQPPSMKTRTILDHIQSECELFRSETPCRPAGPASEEGQSPREADARPARVERNRPHDTGASMHRGKGNGLGEDPGADPEGGVLLFRAMPHVTGRGRGVPGSRCRKAPPFRPRPPPPRGSGAAGANRPRLRITAGAPEAGQGTVPKTGDGPIPGPARRRLSRRSGCSAGSPGAPSGPGRPGLPARGTGPFPCGSVHRTASSGPFPG